MTVTTLCKQNGQDCCSIALAPVHAIESLCSSAYQASAGVSGPKRSCRYPGPLCELSILLLESLVGQPKGRHAWRQVLLQMNNNTLQALKLAVRQGRGEGARFITINKRLVTDMTAVIS